MAVAAEEITDEALMARLGAGDDAALAVLMDRWELRVKAFLARLLPGDPESEDLAQQTFVRLYQARARYAPTARFSTWLFTIAANLARNRVRWHRRHPTDSLDAPVAGPDGAEAPRDLADARTPLPAEAAILTERAAAVRAAIAALPEEARLVVVLFEYEERSYAEIAAVAGCSEKAVEMRLYRARDLLRRQLARWLVH